ncbi:MAG: hypothetical protein AB1Z23_11810 [Eubacteriales bacterium]
MVSYRGDIEINLKQYENSQHAVTQDTLLQLSEYWKEIGFESEVQVDGNIYHTYFLKQKQCTSYEEAFAELFKMMSDEYSPFKSLSYKYTHYQNYDEYNITGQIDVQQVIDKEALAALPADIQEVINNEINNMSAYIIFDLPNYENTPPTSVAEAKYDILYNEIASFSYTGKIDSEFTNTDTVAEDIDLRYYNMLNFILAGILAVLMILIVIIIVKSAKDNQSI